MATASAVQSQPVVGQQQPPENVSRFEDAKASIPNEKLAEVMKTIVGELQSEADRRVGLRQTIEDRWIEDLEQYHARYDAMTEAILKKEERSRLFINMTRPKTNAMGARFKDLLFPTDEKNWGITPTPVPRLTEAAEKAAQTARQLEEQAIKAQQQAQQAPQPANDNQPPAAPAQDPGALQKAADDAKQAWAMLNAQLVEAKRRSDLMQEVIDDQLTECNYQAIKRDQIDWAMKIGSGITKGPVTGDRMRRGWKQDSQGGYYLDMAEGDQPGYRLVDPWGFFPDLDVAKIEDGNGEFERHLMNPKKLRGLQKLSGFDVDALRRLLSSKPISSAPAYVSQLRNIRGEAQDISGTVYHVWEYNGPLEPEQMRMLAIAMGARADRSGDQSMQRSAQAAFDMVSDVDPLVQVRACVWFCDGEVLKFALYPYDSGECMYSVFNLVKDESCVFGYGMPSILRDLQSAFNAAWRGMMDNAGISSGPQIVIDKSTVEPADGDYVIRPRKVWFAVKGITKENLPFQVFNIQNNQAELANIIILAERLIDVVSTMPQIAQGEQGEQVTQTAQGMGLLMNSANVVFRDGVKNWDDDVTVPDIRRLYDWNMQFNPKGEIKGDYDVKARGSSVLLVREIQATSLMTIALQFGAHPVFGPMLKNYELLGKIFQAHMIPSEEIMLTEEQYEAVLAAAEKQREEQAKQGAEGATEAEKIKLEAVKARITADIAINNADNDYKLRVAKMGRDTAMMELAGKQNMNLDQIQAMLTGKAMDNDHKERALAVEAAVTQQQSAQEQHGGGSL